MASEKTPIEILANSCEYCMEMDVQEVLVPEQCMMATIGDKEYHITIEELTDEEDKAAPVESAKPAEPAMLNKSEPEFVREAEEAVRKAKKEIKEFACSELMRIRKHFDVIALDLTNYPFVMCNADSLEDLFDQLAPWHVEGTLGLYEKLNIVRAMRAASEGPSQFDHGLDCDFTKPFQINEDFPPIIIQMS